MGHLRSHRQRSPAAFTTLALAVLAALAIALPTTGSAATTVTWLASVGAAGANGKAAISAPDTAGTAGSLKLSLTGLSPSTTYPIKIQAGTCASPGSTLFTAPSQKSSSAGKISKVVAIPAAKMTGIRAARSLIIRAGSGSKVRCGPFTGGPLPTPTPTPTPEPSLAAAIATTSRVGYLLADIAADTSGVWAVDLIMGYAYRIDPMTGAESGMVDYSATLYVTFGCALGEGALWVPTNRLDGPGGTIVRIDPATRTIPARIEVPGRVFAVTTGGGSVWIAQSGPDQLVRIDPAKNVVSKVYPVKSTPYGVAYAGGYAWLTTDHALLKIDLTDSDVTSIPLQGEPRNIAVVDGSLWVTAAGTGTSPSPKLLRIAPETGAVLATIDLPAKAWDIAGDAGYVWVAPSDDASPWAVAISTATNRIVGSVTLPIALQAVAVRGRTAWFAGADDAGGVVVRVVY